MPIDECVSTLTEKLQNICSEHTRVQKVRRRAEPWWVPQPLIELKQVLAARRRYMRCEDGEQKKEYEILFRKMHSKFRGSVRRAEREHYQKIIEEIETGDPLARISTG